MKERTDIIRASDLAREFGVLGSTSVRWILSGWLDGRKVHGEWWVWKGSLEGFVPPRGKGRPTVEDQRRLRKWARTLPRLPRKTWEAWAPPKRRGGRQVTYRKCPHCGGEVASWNHMKRVASAATAEPVSSD